MTNNLKPFNITITLAHKLIAEQFPEFAHLPVLDIEKQGHDNRTYRLGSNMLIRMPTTEAYALKVPKEQELLPYLAQHLTISIPTPIKMGKPSEDFPFSFSIYKWLDGKSANFLILNAASLEHLSLDLTKFLKELHNIKTSFGPIPGQHNWWRGDHISIYDKDAKDQIAALSSIIDIDKALKLWNRACQTKWDKPAVWIHGDLAADNILIKNEKLSAIIDFGGMGIGDPACDLVIAWTYLKDKAREIFIQEMTLDEDTWLRAKAWALWKATFELCQFKDKTSHEASVHQSIIEEILIS